MFKRVVFVFISVVLVTILLPFSVTAQGGEEAHVAAKGGPPPARPYAGCWQALDSLDGSQQYIWLQMKGRSRLSLMYVDWGASWCGTDAEGELNPAYIWSQAVVENDTLNPGTGMIVCWADPPFDLVEVQLNSSIYDPATDTITDALGDVWTRAPMNECFPTPPRR